jgi:hypothetical protein
MAMPVKTIELDAAVTEATDLRVSGEPLLPSRETVWADLIVPEVADAELGRDLRQATRTARLFATRLEPELAFVNLRKGSFPYVRRADSSPDPEPEDLAAIH